MAIQDSFNLSQATISQTYAYKCWYNYNYGGNTMGISAKDMGQITQAWDGELKNWRATASKDENAYEISDDDFSVAKATGKNDAKNKTGYDGGKGGMIGRGVADAAVSVGGAVAGAFGTKIIGEKAINAVGGSLVKKSAEALGKKASAKVAEEAAKTVTEDVAKEMAKGATKEAAKKTVQATTEKAAKEAADGAINKTTQKAGNKGWIVAAPLALAVGTAYQAKKPNKEQKEACDALQEEMNNAQGRLYSTQEDMDAIDEELIALSDEAQAYNEDANEEIEENKTEFDFYKESYDALMEKVEAGETLTEDEKDLLNQLIPLMQELGENIDETSEDATDTVSDIYGEMDTYQENYDEAAATMAEVEGLTDYAESFDEATRTMCVVEGVSQGLNAASGAKAAAQATRFAASGGWATAWAWGHVAAGAAGAAMSGFGALEQGKWAGEVGTEIHMRRDVQDINTATNEIYDERIDDYAGYMEGVDDLELEIPDDIEAPTETPEVTGEEGGSENSTFGITPEQDDKDIDKKE